MDSLLNNLRTAIFNVMDQMYFLMPDNGRNDGAWFGRRHYVYIGITGEPRMMVRLVFDHELAAGMSATLMGITVDRVTAGLIRKTLLETANVIAGRLLLFFDRDQGRNVTLPSTRKRDIFGEYGAAGRERLQISFGGRGVLVVVETAG